MCAVIIFFIPRDAEKYSTYLESTNTVGNIEEKEMISKIFLKYFYIKHVFWIFLIVQNCPVCFDIC